MKTNSIPQLTTLVIAATRELHRQVGEGGGPENPGFFIGGSSERIEFSPTSLRQRVIMQEVNYCMKQIEKAGPLLALPLSGMQRFYYLLDFYFSATLGTHLKLAAFSIDPLPMYLASFG